MANYDEDHAKKFGNYNEVANFVRDPRRLMVIWDYVNDKSGKDIIDMYKGSGLGMTKKVVYDAIDRASKLKLVKNGALTANGHFLLDIGVLLMKSSQMVDNKYSEAAADLMKIYGNDDAKEFLRRIGQTSVSEMIPSSSKKSS